MAAKAGKSANPAHPDAHPTAPGGMSKANLRIELAEKHGISMDETREVGWPVLIDMVAEQRRLREREVEQEISHNDLDIGADDEDTDADLDDLLSDFGLDEEPEDTSTGEDLVFDPEQMFEEMVAEREAEQAVNPPLFIGLPLVKDYIFDGHAGAGPSASERWMHCTMSLEASRAFLETLSSNQQRTFAGAGVAARQGTTAHAVGEAKANHMLGRIDDDELETTLLDLTLSPEADEAYDEEMDEYVTEYVDLIKSYADERGAEHVLIESRVEAAIPLAGVHEGEVYVIRGSADVIGMPTEDDPVLVVGDLKYGNGIWVDVDENSQARIYALGALDLLTDDEGDLITDVEKIRLHIVQPRMDGIKTWEESIDDLLDWRDDVLSPALTAALYGADGGATYNPGDVACQFCPARGTCPALTEQRVEQAAELFDAVVEAEYEHGPGAFPETTSLSNERLGELLAQISGLINIHSDLKEEAERRLHRGVSVPGYQLVNYTPPRKWVEGADQKLPSLVRNKALREQLFKAPALLTPKQALTVLGDAADKIEDLIETPDKRPVIAREGDRRKPWTGTPPEQMFPDMDGEDA